MDDSRRAQIADAGLAMLLTLLCIGLLLEPAMWTSGVAYGGDEIQTMTLAQAAMEDGHPLRPQRLDAPAGGDWRRFPMRTPLETLVIRALGAGGLSCFTATTLTWVLMGGLTAATATLALRLLLTSRPLSILLGCSYALQPFFWDRYTAHFHLHSPWVPLLAVGYIQLAEGGWPRRIPWRVAVAAFMQGTASLYMSYFGTLIATAAVFLGSARTGLRPWKQLPMLLLPFCLGALFQLVPMRYDRPAKQGTGRLIVDRNLAESDAFSLKLRHLISPRPGHPLPPLSWLERQLQHKFGDERNEASRARLGTLGVLGLLLAVQATWRALTRGPQSAPAGAPGWLGTCCLLLGWTFLLGTVGGFGSLANLAITEKFRCLNRCVVFLEFYALAVLGAYLGNRRLPWSILLLLPAIAWDQFLPPPGKLPHRHQAFLMDQSWVRQLESELKPESMVYQLPNAGFGGATGQDEPYDQAKPYLHSRRLRWSFGAIPNPHPWEEPLEESLKTMVKLGFSALCVDRLGYSYSRQDVPDQLLERLGQPDYTSPDQRYCIFLLDPHSPVRPFPENQKPPLEQPILSPEEAQQVRLEYPYPAPREAVYPTQWLRVSLLIHNRSGQWLTRHGINPVALSYHWVDSQGRRVVREGERTHVPDIPSGAVRMAVADVLTPPRPGLYRLQVRLVQDGVRWFEGDGYENLEIPLQVRWW